MLRGVAHVSVLDDSVGRAFIKYLKLRQLLRIFVDQFSNSPEHLAFLRPRQLAPSPSIEGFASGKNRLLHIRLITISHFGDDHPSGGVEHLSSLTAQGVMPLPTNEQPMGFSQKAGGLSRNVWT
ncbi:hypothetical protein D3C77_498020 [compost metagenome]